MPEPKRDLLNLTVISGLRIGPKLTVASALNGLAVILEGNGKRNVVMLIGSLEWFPAGNCSSPNLYIGKS